MSILMQVACTADSVDTNLNNPYVQLRCGDHGQCSALSVPSYCHVGLSPNINQETDNVCIGCWACCLYPEVYRPLDDICPPWCNCNNVGQLCSNSDDCAAGYFCEILNGNCQACHRCGSDAVVAGGGACTDHCAYGGTGMPDAQTSFLMSVIERLVYTALGTSRFSAACCHALHTRPSAVEHAGDLAPFLTGAINLTQSFDYHAFTSHDLFLWYMPEQQECPSAISTPPLHAFILVCALLCCAEVRYRSFATAGCSSTHRPRWFPEIVEREEHPVRRASSRISL